MQASLRYIFVFLTLFFLQSCSESQKPSPQAKTEITNKSTPVQTTTSNKISNLSSLLQKHDSIVLSGSINQKHPVFITLYSRDSINNCKEIQAKILYRENNIKFNLSGKICNNKLELNRYKNKFVRESFSINLSQYPLEGTWKKEDKEAVGILLEVDSTSLIKIPIEKSFPLFKQFIKEVLLEDFKEFLLDIEDIKLVNDQIKNLPYGCHWDAYHFEYFDRGNYEDYDNTLEWKVSLINRDITNPVILLEYQKDESSKVSEYEEENELNISIYKFENGHFNLVDEFINFENNSLVSYSLFPDRLIIEEDGTVNTSIHFE